MLIRHARRLLANGQLYRLSQFAIATGYPLGPWLEKERDRAAKIQDFSGSLNLLHLQFEIPYPQAIDFEKSLSQNPPQPPRLIQQLLTEMLGSRCVDWAILLATISLNLAIISRILKDAPQERFIPFFEALKKHKAQGYQLLKEYLETHEFF